MIRRYCDICENEFTGVRTNTVTFEHEGSVIQATYTLVRKLGNGDFALPGDICTTCAKAILDKVKAVPTVGGGD